MRPKSNKKFISLSYVPSIHSLKLISYNSFGVPVGLCVCVICMCGVWKVCGSVHTYMYV